MRKIFFAVCAAALLFSCSNGESKEKKSSKTEIAPDSNWAKSHLSGKVKSIEEMDYTADSTGVVGVMDSCCIKIDEFNNTGYVMKNIDKNNEGMVVEETIMERTEDGKFVSAKSMKDGVQVWGRTTHYNAEGKIDHAVDTDTSGMVFRIYTDVTENEIGQALKGKSLDRDSVYLGTWTFSYTDGIRTGNTWVDSSGVKLYERVGAVNEKGWIAKNTIIRVDKDGTRDTTVKMMNYDSFDDAGNWTQRTESDADGKTLKVQKRSYTYYE